MDVDAISLRTKERPVKATHVGLLGYDHDECGNQYCCSFPFDKAIDPYGDVIVAFSEFFFTAFSLFSFFFFFFPPLVFSLVSSFSPPVFLFCYSSQK